MIEALIFDMDGLLVDSEPLAAAAMDRFLARYGIARRADVQHRVLGRRLPEAIAIVREGYGIDRPLDVLIEEYGEMRLAALRGAVKPMPGAKEIIEFGRSVGLRMALATSGMRTHANVSLSETGLSEMFDAEVTGDEVANGKPAPDLFLKAAERLNVDPALCVVFEDAPTGVAAARAAGMQVVAIPNSVSGELEFSVKPDAVLTSLLNAPAWLVERGVRNGG